MWQIFHKLGSPKWFFGIATRLMPWLLAGALALLAVGLVWGLAGFIPCLLLTGYVSLSVLLAACLILFQVACFSSTGALSPAGAYAAGMLLLILWTHRENLKRLAQGRENRFEKFMLRRPRA